MNKRKDGESEWRIRESKKGKKDRGLRKENRREERNEGREIRMEGKEGWRVNGGIGVSKKGKRDRGLKREGKKGMDSVKAGLVFSFSSIYPLFHFASDTSMPSFRCFWSPYSFPSQYMSFVLPPCSVLRFPSR